MTHALGSRVTLTGSDSLGSDDTADVVQDLGAPLIDLRVVGDDLTDI